MYEYNENWSRAVSEELQAMADQAKEKREEKKEKSSFWVKLREMMVLLKKKAPK